MEKILKEVKKLTGNQKLKLYNALQKDLYSPDTIVKKELTPAEWKKVTARVAEIETGKVKGISLSEHLRWLKQRRNAV
jgi:hypothetical protein